MNRRWIITGAVVGALLVVAYFASPYLAVRELRSAAISADVDRLNSVVDFPSVRESLKAQMNSALTEKLANDSTMKDNPFAGLATIMIPAMVEKAVDGFVTPEAFSRLVEQGKLKNDGPDRETSWNEYRYAYRDLDHFAVDLRTKNSEPSTVPTFIFERRGAFSWKVVRVELPPSIFKN